MRHPSFDFPLQFADDPNGAALDAQDYYGPSMSAITHDPVKSRWADAQGPLVLARADLRIWAHAYQHDSRPPDSVVFRAQAYPVRMTEE